MIAQSHPGEDLRVAAATLRALAAAAILRGLARYDGVNPVWRIYVHTGACCGVPLRRVFGATCRPVSSNPVSQLSSPIRPPAGLAA